jgi:hypothetical protein
VSSPAGRLGAASSPIAEVIGHRRDLGEPLFRSSSDSAVGSREGAAQVGLELAVEQRGEDVFVSVIAALRQDP